MPESCDPNWVFSTLVNQLISLCSFPLSHPLYFSYLIFFAPYILKLISFLSPLFLTTSLLSLTILTAFVHDNNFYHSVVEKLRRRRDHPNEEFHSFDDLGMYETLFGSTVMEERESAVDSSLEVKPEELEKSEGFAVEKVELNSVSGKRSQMEERESLFSEEKPEELERFEDFAVDKVELNSISGKSSPLEVRESAVESFTEEKPEELEKFEDFAVEKVELNSITGKKTQMEEKRMENFLKILVEFEKMASNVEEKKKPDPKPDKAVEKQKAVSLLINNGSDAINGAKSKSKSHSQRITSEEREVGGGERKLIAESSRALLAVNSNASDAINGAKSHSQRITSEEREGERKLKAESSRALTAVNSNASDAINGAKSHSQRITSEEREGEERKLKAESSRALMAVNSYGSMRREEKEWKRTLACKLFEERHNVDGGEGMDSLWEAYEIDSTKQTNNNNKKKTKTKTKKFVDEEEEDEDEVDGPLCCLQALKLSTGKMNLVNVAKFSKAFKGIGWLHSVSKHSKKVHNNNGDRY